MHLIINASRMSPKDIFNFWVTLPLVFICMLKILKFVIKMFTTRLLPFFKIDLPWSVIGWLETKNHICFLITEFTKAKR